MVVDVSRMKVAGTVTKAGGCRYRLSIVAMGIRALGYFLSYVTDVRKNPVHIGGRFAPSSRSGSPQDSPSSFFLLHSVCNVGTI